MSLYGSQRLMTDFVLPTEEELQQRTRDTVTRFLDAMEPGDKLTIEKHDRRNEPDGRMYTITFPVAIRR